MKWTMTSAEMSTLFNLDLYVIGWNDDDKWGNIARPNLRYCKADAPVFEWRDDARLWHVVSAPAGLRQEG